MLLLLLLMADLDDVAFLTGHWQNESTEEQWLAPKGHLMLGVGRTVKERNTFFEFLRIENRKEGVVYVALPQGRNATEFKWVSGTRGKEAVFENLAHDFPQRIKYWIDDKGRLHARVEDKTGKKAEEFTYTSALKLRDAAREPDFFHAAHLTPRLYSGHALALIGAVRLRSERGRKRRAAVQ